MRNFTAYGMEFTFIEETENRKGMYGNYRLVLTNVNGHKINADITHVDKVDDVVSDVSLMLSNGLVKFLLKADNRDDITIDITRSIGCTFLSKKYVITTNGQEPNTVLVDQKKITVILPSGARLVNRFAE